MQLQEVTTFLVMQTPSWPSYHTDGSIGIFGMFPNAKGLTDKIGVNFDVVKTNKYADFGMLTRPMNDGEKADANVCEQRI